MSHTMRDILILLLITLVMALAATFCRADGGGTTIRLYDQAVTPGAQVRLRDVARITGPQAAELAGLPLATFVDQTATLTIKLADVEKLLELRGVNRAQITLDGFISCVVARGGAAKPATLPLLSTVPPSGAAVGGATLRDRVLQTIENLAGVTRDRLRITFGPDGERILARAIDADRYEIDPQATVLPGRLPLVVRRYQGDILIETVRLTADVAQHCPAVVATRDLSRGQIIGPQDVEIREVLLRTPAQPVADVRQVVGQVCKSVLRAGAVVQADYVQAPVVVKRGEMMTVRCFINGLVVTTSVRAMGDGMLGQPLTVRNEHSRKNFTVRVTGPNEGILSDDGGGGK